ncbi:non-specific lipid-transfer protein A-like [Nicotiana tabacum]|uniref:Non-specific lipid-transfer protein n=2 Tax=Nicotiana TaxID=4085 RepID=A0A1S4DIJ7_TOBAC|nr:PREDICTED: non-specific lipid-transfer protein A-like [Nicotiana sylvestris]XP_016513187.1 PREDICTED: non-specific lipid-transfer protein A-like [Nicotiana tabacum]
MAKILIALFALSLILGQTNADIQCSDVISKVSSCEGYLLGKVAAPSPNCCFGLQDLAKVADDSQPDRQTICQCFKAAMQTFPVDFQKAKQLPQICHFKSTIPIEPNVDCSK